MKKVIVMTTLASLAAGALLLTGCPDDKAKADTAKADPAKADPAKPAASAPAAAAPSASAAKTKEGGW